MRSPLTADSGAGAASVLEIQRIANELAPEAELGEALGHAYRRALALTTSAGPGVDPERGAAAGFAADMITALAPGLALWPGRLQTLIDRLEKASATPRSVLGRDVLRAPQLLQLRGPAAIDVQLALVLAFARAQAVALWTPAADGELTLLAGAGDLDAMPPESHEVAGLIISQEPVAARAEGDLAGVAIHLCRGSDAALLVFGEDVLTPVRRSLLEAATPLLSLALERRGSAGGGSSPPPATGTLGHQAALEEDVVRAAERRLARLRFDLHDGPQQDILMLAEDLRLFRNQLAPLAIGDGHAHLLGRVDDLEARLIALDGDLRRISVSVQSPFLHRESFEDALSDLVGSFSGRCGVAPTVRLDGNFTSLTDSQHITLLGLIREALSNVREHSGANHVEIRVSAKGGAVTVSVADDGLGFDPEATLVRAARRGRLGLVGMHERVRLLGGSTKITSREGGPTVVEALLPPPPVGAPRRNA